jgi:hypothetical protein
MSLPSASKTAIRLLAVIFASTLIWACSDSDNNNNTVSTGDPDFPGYTVVSLAPGDDLEDRALEALITAEPNTVIQLPSGTYNFTADLSSSVDNIVLRGTGMSADGGTVLNFKNQTIGSQGILGTGNIFVIQD